MRGGNQEALAIGSKFWRKFLFHSPNDANFKAHVGDVSSEVQSDLKIIGYKDGRECGMYENAEIGNNSFPTEDGCG